MTHYPLSPLDFGIWDLFGIWSLEFGISHLASSSNSEPFSRNMSVGPYSTLHSALYQGTRALRLINGFADLAGQPGGGKGFLEEQELRIQHSVQGQGVIGVT